MQCPFINKASFPCRLLARSLKKPIQTDRLRLPYMAIKSNPAYYLSNAAQNQEKNMM
jgi:hypothetical protein